LSYSQQTAWEDADSENPRSDALIYRQNSSRLAGKAFIKDTSPKKLAEGYMCISTINFSYKRVMVRGMLRCSTEKV